MIQYIFLYRRIFHGNATEFYSSTFQILSQKGILTPIRSRYDGKQDERHNIYCCGNLGRAEFSEVNLFRVNNAEILKSQERKTKVDII